MNKVEDKGNRIGEVLPPDKVRVSRKQAIRRGLKKNPHSRRVDWGSVGETSTDRMERMLMGDMPKTELEWFACQVIKAYQDRLAKEQSETEIAKNTGQQLAAMVQVQHNQILEIMDSIEAENYESEFGPLKLFVSWISMRAELGDKKAMATMKELETPDEPEDEQ